MNFNFPTYLVGGAVRDELLGIPCKDLDYVMVVPSFEAMKQELLSQGCKIFVEKPEFLTIRCKHPELGCVDFACARKDGCYTDGRRPDSTDIASNLEQDLARRDFTCNAIAKSLEHGRLLDPFHGVEAIEDRQLRAVGSARARFDEDKLRAFRALRFAITKNFRLDTEICNAIGSMTPMQFDAVSTERIREELIKMFKVNPARSFSLLNKDFPVLWDVVVNRGIWFRPTTEQI
jgi:tRNA nucleotidyltransferase/poly(A) polymerase